MLILIVHGSRNPSWRASVEKMTEGLQADLGRDQVRLAYMDCAPPTLTDVVSDAIRGGAKRIRVLPLFLAAEGHVDRNIRPLVDQLRQDHKSIDVELLPPVGQQPLFVEMLRKFAVGQAEQGSRTQ